MILFEYINRVMAWHKSRDRGATAVEYALIVGAIVAVIGVLVFALGDEVKDLFTKSCAQIHNDSNVNAACNSD